MLGLEGAVTVRLVEIDSPVVVRFNFLSWFVKDIISLLKTMIRLGHGYDRLKPIAMGICESYANGIGWDAAGFCPGTLDNFGPHVRIVLKMIDDRFKNLLGCIHSTQVSVFRKRDLFEIEPMWY